MKKLIPMMFAAIFLCNISYGASISDLLGSKKSVILKCVTDKGYSITSEGIVDRPGWIGEVDIWEIRDGKYLYWDNEQKSFGKNEEFVSESGYKILNKLTITEDKYRWKFRQRNKDDDKLYRSYDIEISRNSGRFTFNTSYHYNKINQNSEGTCKKVTDKKL